MNWRAVPDTNYDVSTTGQVRNRLTNRILKPALKGGGYPFVCLGKYGKQAMIHRLMAAVFLPRPEGAEVVDHINGDKADNRLENLEWVTHSENNLRAYRLGLAKAPPGPCLLGESNPAAKLTPSAVQKIRRLRGSDRAQVIGARFGISRTQVYRVWRGDVWQHVVHQR